MFVDKIFEPLMAAQPTDSLLVSFFGENKGSGAAMLFFIIGIVGILVCLVFNLKLRKYKLISRISPNPLISLVHWKKYNKIQKLLIFQKGF